MGSMRMVRGLVLFAAVMFGLAVWLAVSGRVDAATIEVTPGQSVQTRYNTAASGDVVLIRAGTYTGGINLNRSGVRVEGERGPAGELLVTLRPSSDLTGSAVSVACSDCGVTGVRFENFRYGFGADGITGRNRVHLRDSVFFRLNYHVWISGDDWVIERNTFQKSKWVSGDGDSDYGRIFGNRHVVRRNVFGDTVILETVGGVDVTDGKPGPDYSHTDGLQYYNQNGEVLRDVLIEENVFTDFVQGLFIGNETGNGQAVQRVTVRNNVFWGTPFRATGNLLGSPSWGVYFGKNGPERQIVIENNIFYRISNAIGMLTGTDAICRGNIVANSGTVYILEGTAPSLITRTPGGNALWQNNWAGELGSQGDITDRNPQFQNAAALTVAELLGADGKLWTADDAFRVMNAALADYGPQVDLGGGTDPGPAPTEGTYRVTVNTAQGQTGQTTVAVRRRPRPEVALVVVGAQSRDVVAGSSVTVGYASLVTSGPAWTATTAVVGSAPAGWGVSATSAGFTVSVPAGGAGQSAVYRVTFATAGGQSRTVDVTVRGREVALVMNAAPALVEVEEGSSVLVPWSAIVVSGPGGYSGAVAGVAPVAGVTLTPGSTGITVTAN